MKLALGTVQFGVPYGVANTQGMPDRQAVTRMLACAETAGIDLLDTAAAYGDSEATLGSIGVRNWRVVTKLSAVPDDCADVAGWVRASLACSLERLGLSKVYGLLLHRPAQLLGQHGPAIAQAMQSMRDEGLVQKIGVSVYGPAELDSISGKMPLDLVQAPFNLLDRSLQMSGWLERLKEGGCEVHTRSAFLQGLLLMDKATRPQRFERWDALWQCWHAWLRDSQQTPQAAALGFVLAQPGIDRVVVGVDSVDHLQQLLAASRQPFIAPPPSLASDDPELVNPSMWNRI